MLEQAVRAASQRVDVSDAIGGVYHRLQTEIDRRKPICVASGKCCKFEEYKHRLFISTLELAKFLREWQSGTWSEEVVESLRRWDGAGCPFQIEQLCGVHLARPFGCRIFFCDQTATGWQHERYEQFHSEIKLLHQELNVPYFYVEWRQALKAIGFAPVHSRNAEAP